MKKRLIAFIYALFATLIMPTRVGAYDEREAKMNVILVKYHSPMAGLEPALIKLAEEKGLDWTLLAAIAGTESSFGKRMPHECLNPYGWGIYGDNKLCFESFEKAALAVADGISKKYNTTTLETIARTYNKVSTEGWIRHTRFFMNKIKSAEIPVHALPITL